MNLLILGLVLLYGIPAVLAYLFWAGPIKRIIGHWTHRDLMLSLIPTAWAVHHTERITGIVKREP